MFVVKSFDSMVKNSYSFCADSVNIRIPGPPNLGRRDINLPSVSEQFTPPVIGGMNSVLMTLSNCLSWVLMFSIVLMKLVYVWILWGNQSTLLEVHITLFYTTHATLLSFGLFFSWIYFCLNVSDPITPPRCRWHSVVIFMFVSLKTD